MESNKKSILNGKKERMTETGRSSILANRVAEEGRCVVIQTSVFAHFSSKHRDQMDSLT